MKQRVVVTGMGAITPVGNDIDTFWENVKEGNCGLGLITSFDTSEYKVKVAGEVKDFEPGLYMDRKEARRMDRYSQFSLAAAKQAVDQSGIDLETVAKERFGVIVGSGIGGIRTIESEHHVLHEKGPGRVSPFFVPMIISNMAAGNIAIQFGAKGTCMAVATACATATNAIGEAFRVLQNGQADVMICGGTDDSITPLSVAGFMSIKALSTSEDPTRACIPFDGEREGFVMSEGAGILFMETLEHAQKRGAKIFGEIIGYGSTCDAYHITSPAPDGEGGARAMKIAIEEAGIEPKDVSYINAHGTGTSYNDKFETAAIKAVFNDAAYKIPVSSTKSVTGHLMGAAGAVEAIACIKALEEGFIPPTAGYKVPDPDCDLDYVPNEGRRADLKYALSNSLGFGGHNATILLKKWED